MYSSGNLNESLLNKVCYRLHMYVARKGYRWNATRLSVKNVVSGIFAGFFELLEKRKNLGQISRIFSECLQSIASSASMFFRIDKLAYVLFSSL